MGFLLVKSPLMRSPCYLFATLKGKPVVHGTQLQSQRWSHSHSRHLQSQRWTPFSRSRTSTAQSLYLRVCVYAALIMQQSFPTFGLGERASARKEDVNVLHMALLRALNVRGTCTWTFYVHFYVHGTSACTSTRRMHGTSTCRSHGTTTCTSCASLLRAPLFALCMTNLALTARMFNFIVYVIYIYEFWRTLAGLEAVIKFLSFLYFLFFHFFLHKACAFLCAPRIRSHSEKLAQLFA